MAKFRSLDTPDLVVSTENGFIQFKNSLYTTTNKIEIEALKKALNVIAEGGKATQAPVQPLPTE